MQTTDPTHTNTNGVDLSAPTSTPLTITLPKDIRAQVDAWRARYYPGQPVPTKAIILEMLTLADDIRSADTTQVLESPADRRIRLRGAKR